MGWLVVLVLALVWPYMAGRYPDEPRMGDWRVG